MVISTNGQSLDDVIGGGGLFLLETDKHVNAKMIFTVQIIINEQTTCQPRKRLLGYR